MADNMQVTAVPPPITLMNGVKLAGGAVQFDFAYAPGATCSAWVATDASIPFGNWSFVATPTEVSPGLFQFTDAPPATAALLFYRATCP
jgi:hypothetical protein